MVDASNEILKRINAVIQYIVEKHFDVKFPLDISGNRMLEIYRELSTREGYRHVHEGHKAE